MRSYNEEEEYEQEPREWPEACLDAPGPCVICGKPDCTHACFHCGQPVCMHPTDYQADSACGGWILDWWSNDADDPDEGNEFWCNACLEERQLARRLSDGQEELTGGSLDFPTEEDDEAGNAFSPW